MFVLMVAEYSPPLSDPTPGVARRAEFGNRFRHWRGQSGNRYLFSAVPFGTLTDFRSAVAILAEPAADGRFFAWSAALIDSAGDLHAADEPWPATAPKGSMAFVHFLAETDDERQILVDDLFPPTPFQELNLAA